MKKLRYIIGIVAVFAFSACEKETIDYVEQDGLYFDTRWGGEGREQYWAHQYYTPIEFGNMTDETYTARLRVTASGTIKDYDRPFSIIIGKDSTDAIAGEDYIDFPKEYVLKAGEQYAYIDVTFNRTERMQQDTVTLQLLLQPNEYFTCPFTDYEDNPVYDAPETFYGYNKDATAHKIVVTDMMTKPEGWWGELAGAKGGSAFGKFSRTKWLLMMEVTNTTIEDYASGPGLPPANVTMPFARANAISETFARYLLEQAAKGREYAVIDEDGTMMWCSYINTIDPNAWAEFTKPEDYYKGKNN